MKTNSVIKHPEEFYDIEQSYVRCIVLIKVKF